MRENIREYWETFDELCKISEIYSEKMHDGKSITKEYLADSSNLISRLTVAGKKIGIPKMSEKETSLLLNCLFGAEIREAFIEEAEKLRDEAISMTDLRQGAMAHMMSQPARKKKPKPINREVAKATKLTKRMEEKTEKKIERAERKASKKVNKAWREAAGA